MEAEFAPRVLTVLHEIDARAVLGEAIPEEWTCMDCARVSRGTPAAFVKRDGNLEYLCFECLLTYVDTNDQ
jgi:hypothetical protein